MMQLADAETGVQTLEALEHTEHTIGDGRLKVERRPPDLHPLFFRAPIHPDERRAILAHSRSTPRPSPTCHMRVGARATTCPCSRRTPHPRPRPWGGPSAGPPTTSPSSPPPPGP